MKLSARVEESDPVAELALRRYELRLAKSLAHVVNILDPDVIVPGADEQCRPFISNGSAVD